MKLKYYLRGLGIGIAVTALVMGISLGRKDGGMSDDEIRERARALGMTDETVVLSEALSKEEPGVSGNEMNGGTKKKEEQGTEAEEPLAPAGEIYKRDLFPEQAGEPSGDSEAGNPGGSENEDEAGNPGGSENEGEAGNPGGSEAENAVSIVVSGGDGSGTVAVKLQRAGVISDAAAFDDYLCGNGYDKKICTGVHSFTAGMSEREIAEELTRRIQ